MSSVTSRTHWKVTFGHFLKIWAYFDMKMPPKPVLYTLFISYFCLIQRCENSKFVTFRSFKKLQEKYNES